MALTNAEKQRAWRERREAEHYRFRELSTALAIVAIGGRFGSTADGKADRIADALLLLIEDHEIAAKVAASLKAKAKAASPKAKARAKRK